MKIIIFIFAAAVTLTACSKSSSPSSTTPTPSGTSYYMKFEANGAQKSFTYTHALFLGDHVSLNAALDTLGNSFTINIYPSSGTDSIQTNLDYTGLNIANYNSYFFYAINSPSQYNWGSLWYGENYFTPVHVTVTEVTNVYVKGTFYGKVKKSGATDEIEITNGSFYLQRK